MLNTTPVPHQRVGGTVPVRADIYPANVQFSFGVNRHTRTRAIVTADKVLVLVDASSGPAVLYESRLEDVQVVDRRQMVATTADGEVTISRQGGCGCGSRLRSYRPFGKAIRMEQVPA